jgi:hypothetical protein
MDASIFAGNTTSAFTFYELTASDATEYAPELGLKAIYIMTSGDVVVRDHEDNDTTLAVVAGQTINIRPKQVRATGTTATVMGLFS